METRRGGEGDVGAGVGDRTIAEDSMRQQRHIMQSLSEEERTFSARTNTDTIYKIKMHTSCVYVRLSERRTGCGNRFPMKKTRTYLTSQEQSEKRKSNCEIRIKDKYNVFFS